MNITQFEGMAPQVDSTRLAQGMATKAVNASFDRGALTGLPLSFASRNFSDLMSGQTGSLSRAEGLFYSHMADAWFAFGTRVWRGVDSLIAPQDTWNRVYFADSTGVRYMTSDQYSRGTVNKAPLSYRLGVPAPATSPSASLQSESLPSPEEGATEAPTVARQRVFYVFTLVDDHGHEGAPSLASNGVNVPIEHSFVISVTLSTSGTNTAGRAFSSGSKKRVYRSTSSSQGAAFQFVGEVPFTSTSFSDSAAYGEEAEVVPTTTWYPPPPEIGEIDAVASNFLAGFYGNMVCFSEVKLPHAWPFEYRFPLRSQITAIQSTANGLFIGTTGKPYWAYGADPAAAVPQELDYDYPCLSRESVVDTNGTVIYASHDGLVALDGQQAQLLTAGYFTEADWKALNPSTIKAFAYEGHYVFYAPTTNVIYAMDPAAPKSLTQVTWPAPLASALESFSVAARDARRDRTVLAVGGTSGPVFIEAVSDPTTTVTWVSPKVLGPPRHFTFGRVLATNYPVSLTISAGEQEQTVEVTGPGLFRLPPWRPERYWQLGVAFESGGYSRRAVYDISIVPTAKELSNGS